jgi:hypothetical protein
VPLCWDPTDEHRTACDVQTNIGLRWMLWRAAALNAPAVAHNGPQRVGHGSMVVAASPRQWVKRARAIRTFTLCASMCTICLMWSVAHTLRSVAGPFGHLRDSWRRVFSTGSYAAMCTVVKDQQHDIREFIDYNRWIGFQKFYIYDNNSTQDMRGVLSDYIQNGLVEHYITFGTKSSNYEATPQHVAYRACIDSHRSKHQWLAFFDVDEFLLLRDADTAKPPDIRTFLREYSSYGGLAVSWVMFGSSGHQAPPNASTLTSYTKCAASGSNHVKTIANTRYLLSPGPTPHTFTYRKGHPAVNEAFRPVNTAKTNFTGSRVVLLHYVLKSTAEFAEKMVRGGGSRKGKSKSFFTAMDRSANDTCLMAVERGRQFEACCFAGPGATRPRHTAAAAAAAAAGLNRPVRRLHARLRPAIRR